MHGIYAGPHPSSFARTSRALGELSSVCIGPAGLRPRSGPNDATGPRTRAQVEDFAREEIGEAAHLVASSLSGALSVLALVESPRLFKRAVLICPTGYGSPRPSLSWGCDLRSILAWCSGEARSPGERLRRGIRYYLERLAYHDSRLRHRRAGGELLPCGTPEGGEVPAGRLRLGQAQLGVAEYWPRVPHRTLICWGQEARTTPISEVEEFVRRNPCSEPRVFRTPPSRTTSVRKYSTGRYASSSRACGDPAEPESRNCAARMRAEYATLHRR